MKEFVKQNKPHIKAAAVVGMSRLGEIKLEVIPLFSERKIHTCDTVEQAKGWLATRV